MKLGRWSTTAGNNNSVPPDGFPEGQATSTFNDGMREIMAAVRTVFNNAQFFDYDLTPTYVNANTFTLSGDQTSVVRSGRKVLLQDTQPIYGVVTTASFTAVTTIQVSADASLTAFLSGLSLGIFTRVNGSLPSGMPVAAVSMNISGNMTASSVTANVFSSSAVAAHNICKAWVGFSDSSGAITIINSFNVSSVSKSATGTYKINFTTPFADNAYCYSYGQPNVGGVFELTRTSAQFKYRNQDPLIHVVLDASRIANFAFFR